ncbi:MAG: RIP metalloprotease RseP [Woeseiaceae bacterium]|nr:RIP metalloprotease RseP [Woeseiaceae bacterium]|tara:strand:- start:39330 stop:40664 length:1335 start_codon:yes stop_codon:yes gene_type:complete
MILVSILAFVFAVGLLVTIHEFGHYIVGRYCGMKVLRFSVGFGKPIYSKIAGKDQTEYCLSMIPLGGYVQFLDDRNDVIDSEDEGRAFNHRPISSRVAVLLAGPAFNFLFAIFAYFIIFSNGIMTIKPVIGEIVDNSYAADAGLDYGDRILKIDDQVVDDWESAITSILMTVAHKREIIFQVEKQNKSTQSIVLMIEGDTSLLTEPGALFKGLGFYPWQPPALIGKVLSGGAASKAGLMVGDRILSIDNIEVNSFMDLRNIIADKPGQLVLIKYKRGDFNYWTDAQLSHTQENEPKGILGVALDGNYEQFWYLNKFEPIDAFSESLKETWASTSFTVIMFTKMLTGDVSSKNISGPFSIAKYAGISAVAGLNQFLKFLALISISLGVINLLPIPMLDGGQIVYQTLEWIKGSQLSAGFQLLGQQFGIMILLLLMGMAFYNDLFN